MSAAVATAYLVDAVRTPVGRRGGALSQTHPVDLAGHIIAELLARTRVDPERVDDVLLGCSTQGGAQAFNIARLAWISAGLPVSVPGATIDRQCGSGQQAIHFAAQGIAAGSYDLVVAGGVEVMSVVPIASAALDGQAAGHGWPLDATGWSRHFPESSMSQFEAAELLAEQWGISREEMEAFARSSHERALGAWTAGAFDREVVPVDGARPRDETIRENVTAEGLAALEPLLPGGRITAGLSSPISDGAAVALVASEAAVERFGLRPRARVVALTVVGSDPVLMLTGPVEATRRVLERAGLRADEIELYEVNEAFASVPLVWQRETGIELERLNVNGGALALGHPMGATGARLAATLVGELERRGARYGLQTLCEGGGMANAMILESCA